jgi:hypothetical protein
MRIWDSWFKYSMLVGALLHCRVLSRRGTIGRTRVVATILFDLLGLLSKAFHLLLCLSVVSSSGDRPRLYLLFKWLSERVCCMVMIIWINFRIIEVEYYFFICLSKQRLLNFIILINNVDVLSGLKASKFT